MSFGFISDETLHVWKAYSRDLSSKKVDIHICEDKQKWEEIKKDIFGDFSSNIENGLYIKHNSIYSIYLFCAHSRFVEEIFETYLHELAHVFLHSTKHSKHYLELEIEVHDWININFWKELNRLNNAISILKGRKSNCDLKGKPTKKETARLKQEQPSRFFLIDTQKSIINKWINEIEDDAKSFQQINERWKKRNK